MFSIKTLQENNKNVDNINTLTSNEYSFVYEFLKMNDELHDIEVESTCNYYSNLSNVINESSMQLLQEGMLGIIKNKILKIISSIIEFVKNFTSSFGKNQSSKKFEESKSKSSGFDMNFKMEDFNSQWKQYASKNSNITDSDREAQLNKARENANKVGNTEFMFVVFKYPAPNEVNGEAPKSAIATLMKQIEDICSGKEVTDADDALLRVAYKELAFKTKGTRADYKGSPNSDKTYKEYVKTNVIYHNKQKMSYNEWKSIVSSIPKYESDFRSNTTKAIQSELSKAKYLVENAKSTIEPESLKIANTYIGYIKNIVTSWVWFIDLICKANTTDMNNAVNTYNRIKSRVYIGDVSSVVDEAGMIHGEPFDSDTLFDNEDLRDFNRTEWMDISLTTECFEMKYQLMESYRRIVLQEALILTDDKPNKISRLNAMREAEGGKIKSAAESILANIRKIIDKFLESVKNKYGFNERFISRNMDAIRNPINNDMKCSSKGDVLAGMYRIQDNLTIQDYDYESMKSDLESKETFFKNRIMSSLNKESQYSKRKVSWESGMSITDYCKAYYGASLPDDKYKPCEFTGKELETNKNNIIKFLQSSNTFINPAKADLNKLEAQSKRIGNDASNSNSQTTTSNSSTQESYMSYIYGRVITEMDIDNGNTNNTENSRENGQQNSAASDSAKAFKVYLDCYKDVLLSKITAAEFVVTELMQVIRNHAQAHMTEQQKNAEANIDKEAKEKEGNK